jgi:hypothetical protein
VAARRNLRNSRKIRSPEWQTPNVNGALAPRGIANGCVDEPHENITSITSRSFDGRSAGIAKKSPLHGTFLEDRHSPSDSPSTSPLTSPGLAQEDAGGKLSRGFRAEKTGRQEPRAAPGNNLI